MSERDWNAIEEALRELRARMEGFKHHGDDWLWEEQEAAEGAVKRMRDEPLTLFYEWPRKDIEGRATLEVGEVYDCTVSVVKTPNGSFAYEVRPRSLRAAPAMSETYRSGKWKGLPKRCECGGKMEYARTLGRVFSACDTCTPGVTMTVPRGSPRKGDVVLEDHPMSAGHEGASDYHGDTTT